MVQAVIVDGEHADKPVAQQDRHELPTLVLAASVRHPLHIIEAAKAGADIATVPFKVVEQVAKQPLTDKSIESFQEDWRRFTQETGGR